MKCYNCNHEISAGAKFCAKCGSPVSVQLQNNNFQTNSARCPSCNASLFPNAVFCTKCGTPITQQKTTSSSKVPKKTGSWKKKLIALIVAAVLLGAFVFIFIYFDLFSLISPQNNQEEIQAKQEEDEEKETISVIDDYESEAAEPEIAEEPETNNNPASAETPLKDYENPEYMNGPKQLGRSERESILDFVAPVPDDSIVMPEDGSIPVQYFDPSIHEYELFIDDVTYTEAEMLCEEKGGHLATIVCKEELDLIQNLLRQSGYQYRQDPYHIWLGIYIDPDTETYTWCTGEGIGISNWKSGEPTQTVYEDGQREEYIEMSYDASIDQWVWSDVTEDMNQQSEGSIAYLCEWEIITDVNYYEDLKTR